MKPSKGPEFIRFFRPILEIIRETGGSSPSSEVLDRAIELLGISEAEQQSVNKNGQSRVRNQIHWARQYLAWSGHLDSSSRGIWKLSPKGWATDLSQFSPLEVFRDAQALRRDTPPKKRSAPPTTEDTPPEEDNIASHRTRILEILRMLPPEGFERLSQRLLRESGFQQVTITGKSGDGGIDGVGTLQLNPFVSFTVLFQCKRYRGVVTPAQVRDFRGAMMGRADKGIIITTGTFTVDARKEARRDGVPPIELVDGDALVDLFERYQIGLAPRQAYEIVEPFFDEFRQSPT